jgi:hypothetical protein
MLLIEAYANGSALPVLGTRMRCGRVHREGESFVYAGTAKIGGAERPVVMLADDVANCLTDGAKFYALSPQIKVLWESDEPPWTAHVRCLKKALSRRAHPVAEATWPEMQPIAVRFEPAPQPSLRDFKIGDALTVMGADPMLFCGNFRGHWLLATTSAQDIGLAAVGTFRVGDESWRVMCAKPFNAHLVGGRAMVDKAKAIQRVCLNRPQPGALVGISQKREGIYIAATSPTGSEHLVAIEVGGGDPISPNAVVREVKLVMGHYLVVKVAQEVISLRGLPTPERIDLGRRIGKELGTSPA